MSVKTFTAIFVLGSGYVCEQPNCAKYVSSSEDATLYPSNDAVSDALEEYGFKNGEYRLDSVPVVVLPVNADKGESSPCRIRVLLDHPTGNIEVFSLSVVASRINATVHNIRKMLHVMFSLEERDA